VTVTLGQPLSPDPEVFAALAAGVWERSWWTNGGTLVGELERRVADAVGTGSALATNSGTSALTVALVALGLPPGSAVVTSPLTFRATSLAIEAAGLVPRFASVSAETLNLDAAGVAGALGGDTSAILPVHLFGVPVDRGVDELAEAHGLPVVFDGAHAYGLPGLAGRGAATAYSLHATKLLHTGEGGILATDRADLADRVREVRNFGIDGGGSRGPGVNAKMPELSAAVGLAMWELLGGEIAARELVRERVGAIVAASDRVTAHAPGSPRALVMEVIRCDPRDQGEILAALAARGVQGRAFPALTEAGQRWDGFPVVGGDAPSLRETARSVIALPLHGRVREEHLEAIRDVLVGGQ
jgi:dTDP-4-amino-4,6-dideoxygalactose transaminase